MCNVGEDRVHLFYVASTSYHEESVSDRQLCMFAGKRVGISMLKILQLESTIESVIRPTTVIVTIEETIYVMFASTLLLCGHNQLSTLAQS